MRVAVVYAVGALSAFFLSGCAGAPAPTPVVPTTTASTPADVLKALVAQGKLPSLDVSGTVAGSDANGNGVRDDLDTYFAALPDSATQKKALLQMAASIQSAMTVDTTNSTQLTATASALNGSVACIFQVYQGSAAAQKAYLVEELSVNTKQRLQAYDKYNTARSGSTVALATGTVCK